MALTPEVVVNKKPSHGNFKYDQDEVDDFLDEIVEELRRLNQENDELRCQVARLKLKPVNLHRTSPCTCGRC